MSDLPDGWGFGSFPEYVEINPKLNSPHYLSSDSDVSFIKMEDVSNNAVVQNMRIRKYAAVAKGFTKFNNQDVLVAKITPCFENGKGGFVDNLQNGVGFGSTEFHVFRAKSNFSAKYLYQFTNFPTFRLEAEVNMCGTGGQQRVQTEFFKTYKIAVPPLPEQQKIAKILTSVDQVIEKTQAQIDKLKDLKTAMMQELLTKGIGHTEFKDSPVGRIPVGWEVNQISELAEIKGGKRLPKGSPFSEEKTPYPYIRISDFSHGSITMSNIKYVRTVDWEKIKRYTISINDLYVSIAGVYLGLFGEVPIELDGALLTENAAKLVFKDTEKLDTTFVRYMCQSKIVQSQLLQEKGVGAGVPKLALFRIAETYIPLPNKTEQKRIATILSQLDLWITSKETKLYQVKNTKKALMQDLLTGKVRVKVDKSE